MVVAMMIVLRYMVPVSCFVDALSDVAVDVFIGALGRLSNGTILGVVLDIGVEVLPDANVNSSAVVMTDLEFAVPTTFEEFSW